MTADLMAVGIKDKLMGQVNLVLEGTSYVRDGGSFTLISGILGHDPIRAGSSASMVNGAIDSFVKAAAIELPRGIRINAVSPTVFEESMEGYGRSSAATSRFRWPTPRSLTPRASKAPRPVRSTGSERS